MNLNLLPTCLQCYLPEISLENDFICWCHFITDIIVYTYDEFGRNCLKNKWNSTRCSECCVGSLLQYIYVITVMKAGTTTTRKSKEEVLLKHIQSGSLNRCWQHHLCTSMWVSFEKRNNVSTKRVCRNNIL